MSPGSLSCSCVELRTMAHIIVNKGKKRSISIRSRGRSYPTRNPATMLKPVVLLVYIVASWAAEICCPEIGCFNDNPPFDGMPLPDCMNVVNPHYTMYTRSNPNDGQAFNHTSVPVTFNGSLRTVFIAHGYQSSGSSSWLSSMKDAFIIREDINVVIVDWGGGANILNYLQAASNVRSTGAYTALVVNNLVASGNGSHSRMWCVGHSLGSHVCGHCGMRTNLGRITGMDPAGPSFQTSPDLKIGLNPTCASFVDVIHTDTTTFGTLRNIGHLDFYPSSGKNQPGCISSLLDDAACSHSRAHEYMENSIRQDCFQSRSRCNSYTTLPGSCSSCTCGMLPCAYMGYRADFSCQLSGIFYLDISDSTPYCLN